LISIFFFLVFNHDFTIYLIDFTRIEASNTARWRHKVGHTQNI